MYDVRSKAVIYPFAADNIFTLDLTIDASLIRDICFYIDLSTYTDLTSITDIKVYVTSISPLLITFNLLLSIGTQLSSFIAAATASDAVPTRLVYKRPQESTSPIDYIEVYILSYTALHTCTSTLLRISTSCIRLFKQPPRLSLSGPSRASYDKLLDVPSTYSTLLTELSFAKLGYNILITANQDELLFYCSAGAGIGAHPMLQAMYEAATLELLARRTASGLISLNGLSGAVSMAAQGSLQITTAVNLDDACIELTVTDMTKEVLVSST